MKPRDGISPSKRGLHALVLVLGRGDCGGVRRSIRSGYDGRRDDARGKRVAAAPATMGHSVVAAVTLNDGELLLVVVVAVQRILAAGGGRHRRRGGVGVLLVGCSGKYLCFIRCLKAFPCIYEPAKLFL